MDGQMNLEEWSNSRVRHTWGGCTGCDSLLNEVIDGVDKVKERIKQIKEGKVTSR